MNHRALFIFGTRPEAIKVAPVVRAFAEAGFSARVCSTGQHRGMLDQVLEFFELKPDIDLALMQPDQAPAAFAARAIEGCARAIADEKPDLVLVQGDTTTAFAGAFAGFQARVPVAHIEAGLRSFRKDAPFPEEMNRMLVGDLADLHFAPLDGARANLEREGIRDGVHVVGNTVVDALLLGLNLIQKRGDSGFRAQFPMIGGGPLVLVTLHRRESFGAPLAEICSALRTLAEEDPTRQFIYPVHLNPRVRETVLGALGGLPNVHLIEPLGYPDFLWLMSQAQLILTDSGGVQEEAPSLGVPVLVAREVTERQEGVDAGCARLVGHDHTLILREARIALAGGWPALAQKTNPYGDGHASRRIAEISAAFLASRSA